MSTFATYPNVPRRRNPIAATLRPSVGTVAPNPAPLPRITYNNLRVPFVDIDALANGRVTITVPDNAIDAFYITAYMRDLIDQFRLKPEVRNMAATIARQCAPGEYNCQVRAITSWVMDNLHYMRDPVGVDWFTSPLTLIAQINSGQGASEDCDGHVMLLNSLLGSIGFQTRVVGVKLFDPNYYDHVISQVLINGEWKDIDPCAKNFPLLNYLDKLIAI